MPGLEISGGEFRLVSGNGENVIGQYTFNADLHRVLMRLNLEARTCGVRIEQFSDQGPEVPTPPLITASGPLIAESFQELDRLRIAWESIEPITNYFLCEDVTISKDN